MLKKSIRDIPGVGPVRQAELNACGIVTVKDALNSPVKVWAHDQHESKRHAKFIFSGSLGIGRNAHEIDGESD